MLLVPAEKALHQTLLSTLIRRVEDKLEAKSLTADKVYIRCQCPPASKKVPLTFEAWTSISMDAVDNVWSKSSLLQDRS